MNRLWLLTALSLAACPPPVVSTCVPGRQETCGCPFGVGTQACQQNGTFGPCSCSSGTGGGGGSGGGTASGGGSAGGGSGGGATARVDELVSGSRLRATAWVGSDGSRAAGQVFWDSQLLTYCLVIPAGSALGGVPPDSCLPYPLPYQDTSLTEGTGCSGPALLTASYTAGVQAGAQALVASYGLLVADGGASLTRVTELAIGAVFSSRGLPDGGCLVESYAGSDGGLFSARHYRRTGAASWSEVVSGSRVTE